MGLGAGVAIGQQMAQALARGLNQDRAQDPGQADAARTAAGEEGSAAVVRPEEVMSTLERLHGLHTKGVLTAEEFETKKAELLKKLV